MPARRFYKNSIHVTDVAAFGKAFIKMSFFFNFCGNAKQIITVSSQLLDFLVNCVTKYSLSVSPYELLHLLLSCRRQEKTVMKLVVHAETDKVLGASMCGPDAPEIMQVP